MSDSNTKEFVQLTSCIIAQCNLYNNSEVVPTILVQTLVPKSLYNLLVVSRNCTAIFVMSMCPPKSLAIVTIKHPTLSATPLASGHVYKPA